MTRTADARAVFSDNAHAKDPDKAEPAAIARLQAEGAPFTDTEITYNIRGLLIAGNVTTPST